MKIYQETGNDSTKICNCFLFNPGQFLSEQLVIYLIWQEIKIMKHGKFWKEIN